MARQAVFGVALAMVAAVLLLGLDADEPPGRRASGVVEASAAPVVTLSRTLLAVSDTSLPAPQEVAVPAPEPTVPGTASGPADEPSGVVEPGADPSPTSTVASVGTTSITAVSTDASVTTGPPTTVDAAPAPAPSGPPASRPRSSL